MSIEHKRVETYLYPSSSDKKPLGRDLSKQKRCKLRIFYIKVSKMCVKN